MSQEPLIVAVAALVLAGATCIRLRPRRFYFIRHGQTLLNAAHVRQGAAGGLSDTGRAQAKRVGAYVKRFHVTGIISSTYDRAKETAAIISGELGVPVTYSALFAERRNPSEIIGKRRDLPDVQQIVDLIENAYHADDYRYSDEENFLDLKARARRALRLLTRRIGRETVIVTHHVTLKMILAYMLYGEKLHAADFVKLSFFNTSDNATVTICEYHPLKALIRRRGWSVVSYNEVPD